MKTLITLVILAMAQTANAQWSIEPGIGFVISDDSSHAVSLKGMYQKEEPIFFEGMLLHGMEMDDTDYLLVESSKGNYVYQTSTKIIDSFDHNALFLGAGWQHTIKPHTFSLSVGGVYTKTNEKRNTFTTFTETDTTTNKKTKTYSRNVTYWETEDVSPYMGLGFKGTINEKTSFSINGTFYKTELHDVVYTNIGLNYKF